MEKATLLRIQHAKQSIREDYAELCYYYPQYRIEEVNRDDGSGITVGDLNLLLAFARKRHYQDLLDGLQIATAAKSKKGYRSMLKDLKRTIRQIGSKL